MFEDILKNCRMCPRACGVDRTNGEIGYCKASDMIKIGRVGLHMWEEPCISGTDGSGTVFFSHCNLGCVYCQNYKISKLCHGRYITNEELACSFLDLQRQGANNINLVTGTHYIPQIVEAIKIAKSNGLKIPILFNCGGYESVEALKLLDGYIDIYLPDFKYYDDKYSVKYSNAKHYSDYVKAAIDEMFNQVGKCEFDERGIIKKGVIVRHMMLPGLLFDSKKIIDYLYEKYVDDIYLSIMSQYTPMENVKNYPEINKTVGKKYYDTLINYATLIGIKNAYIQDGGSVGESFIPDFYDD